MPDQTTAMTAAESVLVQILASGPKDSRDVSSAMQAAGISTKQTRTARERLALIVHRSGRREDARSVWALPSHAVEAASTYAQHHVQPMPERKVKVLARTADRPHLRKPETPQVATVLTKPDISGAAVDSTERLPPHLVARVQRRAQIMQSRGLDSAVAQALSNALLQRDSEGSRGVSCAECQNYDVRKGCTAAEFSGGPRDVQEVWFCSYSRRDTP